MMLSITAVYILYVKNGLSIYGNTFFSMTISFAIFLTTLKYLIIIPIVYVSTNIHKPIVISTVALSQRGCSSAH